LRAAAEQERRSLANMIEIMILDYCTRKGINAPERQAQGTAPGK
jgi:hypothetical protein